jgi:hypothetical protein
MLYRVPFWLDNHMGNEHPFMKAYRPMYGPFEDLYEIMASKQYGLLDAKWLPNKDGSHLCHGFNFFHPSMMLEAIDYGCDWDNCNRANWEIINDLAGGWMLYSPGPDLTVETPDWISVPGSGIVPLGHKGYQEKKLFHEYDPTNGTVSYGNIFRTQKNPAGLGTHPHFYQ